MFPSQGGWPLLAGNEGPNSADQACGTAPTPIAQVKILRRPKPHENNQQVQSTGRADERLTTSSAASGGLIKSGRQSEQASFPKSSSHYVDDDEWPSIADAESKILGSQKQKYSVLKKQTDAKLVSNGETNQATPQEVMVSSIISKPNASYANQRFTAQPEAYDTNKVSKAPIKTYKERADEYAKARLRILGSAFSEEDKVSNDDIADIHKTLGDG